MALNSSAPQADWGLLLGHARPCHGCRSGGCGTAVGACGYGGRVTASSPQAAVGGLDLPALPDAALAASLLAQGEAGERALGLLQDAQRVLGEAAFERGAEIAASCVRGALEGLEHLADLDKGEGVHTPARALLKALRKYQPPAAGMREAQPAPAGAPLDEGPRGAYLCRTRRRGRRCRVGAGEAGAVLPRRPGSGWRRRPRHCARHWIGRACTC